MAVTGVLCRVHHCLCCCQVLFLVIGSSQCDGFSACQVGVCARMCVPACVCVCACMHACVRMCVCVCVCVCVC